MYSEEDDIKRIVSCSETMQRRTPRGLEQDMQAGVFMQALGKLPFKHVCLPEAGLRILLLFALGCSSGCCGC
jgi:hypothetical protein